MIATNEGIIVAALKHLSRSGMDVFRQLLHRLGGVGVTPAMLEAVKRAEVMRELLRHGPICPITAEVLSSTEGKWRGGEVFEILAVLVPIVLEQRRERLRVRGR